MITGHNLSRKALNYKEKHKKQKLCLSKFFFLLFLWTLFHGPPQIREKSGSLQISPKTRLGRL